RPASEAKPPPLPAATIEVNPNWLEPPALPPSIIGLPLAPSEATITVACLAEAVRVWIGPMGQVSLASPSTAPPHGFVEAIVVGVSSSSDLASRLGRAAASNGASSSKTKA